jgi:K+-transporting ATPase KdpF subunit
MGALEEAEEPWTSFPSRSSSDFSLPARWLSPSFWIASRSDMNAFYVIGGVVAALLFVYLFLALFKPEMFD